MGALLNYRKLTIENNDSHTTKQLTRQIKQLARKTKLDKLLAGLKDNMWDPVKLQNKRYTPRHTKLNNRHGQQVHDRMRAETFADYYEHEHWVEDREDRPEVIDTPIHPVNEEVNTGEIDMKELEEATRKLKSNKSPGPDGTPSELTKRLDSESRKNNT